MVYRAISEMEKLKNRVMLNKIHATLSVLFLLTWFLGVKSSFLSPLFLFSPPVVAYFYFSLLFVLSALLNGIRKKLGIWVGLLVSLQYLPLAILQLNFTEHLALTSLSAWLDLIILAVTCFAALFHIVEKRNVCTYSNLNERGIYKNSANRNKLNAFTFGLFYNRLVFLIGYLTILLAILLIAVGLLSIRNVNYIENQSAQNFWLWIMLLVTFFSAAVFIRLSAIKYKTLVFAHSFLLIPLMILIPNLFHASIDAVMPWNWLVDVCLVLSILLLVLQVAEVLGFKTIAYHATFRAYMVLPEHSENLKISLFKKVLDFVFLSMLILISILLFCSQSAAPLSANTLEQGLLVQFKNSPIIYQNGNSIIIKNVIPET